MKEYQMRELLKEEGMSEFFKDLRTTEVSEGQIMETLFSLLVRRGNAYSNFKKANPNMTDDELTEAIEDIISVFGLDVNKPCYSGGQDLMYHAIKYGTAKDVEMLIKNGYDCSNSISGYNAYYYLANFPDTIQFEEKMAVFKKYNLNKIESHMDYKESRVERTRREMKMNQRNLNAMAINYLAEESPYAYKMIESFVTIDLNKAQVRLVNKLLELGCSADDMKRILKNGSFLSEEAFQRDEIRYMPIYYTLLESEGIKLSNEMRAQRDKDLMTR